MIRIWFCIFFSIISVSLQGQDLLDQLKEPEGKPEPVGSTFKGTRIINGQSVETRGKGNLGVVISHRFGRLNSGAYHLYGLDEANIRLGLEYAFSDQISVGLGRNSLSKVYDSYLKFRFLDQKKNGFPVTLAWVFDMSINTLKRPELPMNTQRRMSYVNQLLIARKLSPAVSIQLMPSLLHQNLVPTADIPNTLLLLGVGGRVMVSKRVGITGEYYYSSQAQLEGNNSMGLGVDIDTGGHVFQLHFTNSAAMTPSGFLPPVQGNFFDGDIHLGFNVFRSFQTGKGRKDR
ncbi:DUF5777 family beta-barrel protein [Algoriphagus terrigena]|uniref:DUF5777 family beta-barrel protein n=1 Tax=Algoriphagus terrigena TaxID=344884 RepID=UPI00042884E8|nr:DUF5777 family beta-barrel protein [Algoriphagus terrigena]